MITVGKLSGAARRLSLLASSAMALASAPVLAQHAAPAITAHSPEAGAPQCRPVRFEQEKQC